MLTINNISNKNLNPIALTIFSYSCFIIDGQQHNTKFVLNIIAGLEKKYQKDILWNNQKISDFYYLYSSDINFIPAHNNLDLNLTVKQNINFLSSLSETNMLIESAVRFFELENIYNKKIINLNAEEIQKVKLSQLIFSPKTIWLIEDADINLSQKWREKLFNLITTRIKEGGLVIMSCKDIIFNKIAKIINLDDFKK